MKPFEVEIDTLNNIIFEMFELVQQQVKLTKDILLTSDSELSCEVMLKEKKVNAYELTIDREVEEFLAMHHPVATDLRFAIAILKVAGNLERIGDHTYRMSSFVFDDLMKLDKELVKLSSIDILFDEIDEMMDLAQEALETGDSALAKKVFKKDKIIDKINKSVTDLIVKKAGENVDDLNTYFLLSKCIGKLERIGDLVKNIAEDILFYHDSKVVKHKKKNKRIDKKLTD